MQSAAQPADEGRKHLASKSTGGTTDLGDPSCVSRHLQHLQGYANISFDPWENRTPVFAVRGRCLSRLTNGPYYALRLCVSRAARKACASIIPQTLLHCNSYFEFFRDYLSFFPTPRRTAASSAVHRLRGSKSRRLRSRASRRSSPLMQQCIMGAHLQDAAVRWDIRRTNAGICRLYRVHTNLPRIAIPDSLRSILEAKAFYGNLRRHSRCCPNSKKYGVSRCDTPYSCEKRDLNPYGVNHTPLKRARLPVPPLSHSVTRYSIADGRYYTILSGVCQYIFENYRKYLSLPRSLRIQRSIGVP